MGRPPTRIARLMSRDSYSSSSSAGHQYRLMPLQRIKILDLERIKRSHWLQNDQNDPVNIDTDDAARYAGRAKKQK